MPDATPWPIPWLWLSPAPIDKPSSLRMSTQAREARETASTGGSACMGTPPTPIPPLRWMGISAASVHGLTMVHVRATFQATVLPVLTLTAGPKMETPALGRKLHLGGRPQPGEPHTVVLELAVHTEHELGTRTRPSG